MNPVPYSETTEAAVIGAVVVWPDLVDAVITTGLVPAHFYVPRFARAWEAVRDLAADDQPVDHHTVAARCGDRQTIADAICEVAGAMPSHAPAWARLIRTHAQARDVIPVIEAATSAARVGDVEVVAELLRDAHDLVAELVPT